MADKPTNKPKRKFLMVTLITRQDEKAVTKVSAHMRRNMSDAARELFRREYERIKREEQAPTLPETVAG